MLKEHLPSFAEQIERQASSISSTLVLPEPSSNNFSFRLSRFPMHGKETIIDIYSSGSRYFITVTRFLFSIRDILKHSLDYNAVNNLKLPIEISISECPCNDPILSEINKSSIFDLASSLSPNIDSDHFFIFYTDSRNCISSGISDPYGKNDEQWIRILNRSYGTALIPPRRSLETFSI